MGRSGGSGGRSSGGSFGGSRGSGGRIGGSFGRNSSGGSSSGSSPFGRKPFGSSNPGSIFRGGRRYGSGPTPGGCGGCGCSNFLVIIVVIVILIIILFSSGINSIFSSSGSSNSDITVSTIEREPLPKGSVNETEYFTDELGWIGNQTTLINGMRYFYQKTGVQPYLYIIDNIDGSNNPSLDDLENFTLDLYDELFTDEAHLLLVFFEYDGNYMDWYVNGTQAKTVIDLEASDILLDYIDRYYYDENLTDEEFFSKSFMDAADRIMKVTKSPWISTLIIFGILAILIMIFFWWKNMKKQKNLEAKQTEEILRTPIEKFKDSDLDDLTDKYDDDNKE